MWHMLGAQLLPILNKNHAKYTPVFSMILLLSHSGFGGGTQERSFAVWKNWGENHLGEFLPNFGVGVTCTKYRELLTSQKRESFTSMSFDVSGGPSKHRK